MSSTVLFTAGAFISFITAWGVVMAGSLYLTSKQVPDDEDLESGHERPGAAGASIPSGALVADPDVPTPAPAH